MLFASTDTAPEASWDEAAPAGFEPAAAPAGGDGDWGAAPAPGAFEAAAASAPPLQYQQPDQCVAIKQFLPACHC